MALTRPRAAQIYDIDYKQATRVVTVANVTLSGGAPSQVDGVTLSLKDRVLVTGQDTASQNGIYYVTTVGTGSNGTWTRSADTDATGELLAGTVVMVTEGLIYADTQWKLTTNDPIVIGTTPLTFVQNYSANSISGGNSNVVVNSNANVTISSAGVANVLNITSTGPIVTGNLLPSANITYNLGSTDLRWKDLWLSNSTLYLGNITVSATATALTVNGANVLTAPANADILTSGNISATGNATAGNVLTSGIVSATGNVTGGNVNFGSGVVSGTGNIYANKIFANIVGNIDAAGSNTQVQFADTDDLLGASANFTFDKGTNLLTVSNGNIQGGNLLTGGYVSATGNVTGGNVATSGVVTASGNITGGNILTAGQISATGNITGDYFLGNVFFANGITASKIYSGNSEVNVTSSGGNVNVSVGGTSNVVVWSTAGEYVTGLLSVSGNVTASNANIIGTTASTSKTTGALKVAGGVGVAGDIYAGNSVVVDGGAYGNVTTTQFAAVFASGAGPNPYSIMQVRSSDGVSGLGMQAYTGSATLYGNTNIIFALGTIRDKDVPSSLVTKAYIDSTGLTVTGIANISGNITGSNISTAGVISATGNATAGNLLTGGLISATGNVTSGNVLTDGLISATGNATAGNVLTTGIVSATGNITGDYFLGNVFFANGITASKIYSGNSEVNVVSSGGNVNVTVGGTSNVAVFAGTGEYVTGLISATGNITGANLVTSGLTSTGTLTTTGNAVIGGNLTVNGNVIYINITDLTVQDPIISIGRGANYTPLTTNDGKDRGEQLWYYSDAEHSAFIGYQNASGKILAASNVTITNEIVTVNQYGSFVAGTYEGNVVSVNGNVTGGNILTAGIISSTGNVTAPYFIGNANIQYTASTAPTTGNLIGAQWYNTSNDALYEWQTDGTSSYWVDVTGPTFGTNGAVTGSSITNGTSNVGVALSGNGTVNIAGTSNVVVWATTGEYITGVVSATGNAVAGNLVTAGLATVTGNVQAGNLRTAGLISATGNINGNNIVSTGAVYSNYNTNTANIGSFMATGGNTKGGTGYLDFLVAQNTSGGATNPYKWLRINPTGALEIINSAYTSTILSLTDSGNFALSGTIATTGVLVNSKQAVNGPAFRAYIATGQSITSGSQQKVTFGSETFDTDANFASSRFTPTVEGYYQLNATVRISGGSGTGECMITIWKNGSEYARGHNESGTEQGAGWYSMQVSDLAYANGTGDYFEIYIQQTSGGNKDTTAGTNISYFSGAMVRGA